MYGDREFFTKCFQPYPFMIIYKISKISLEKRTILKNLLNEGCHTIIRNLNFFIYGNTAHDTGAS